MANELLIQKQELTNFFSSEEKFNEVLASVKKAVNSTVADINTKEGEETIRSTAYKIARTKKAIDDLGKKENAEAQEFIKKVNSFRNKAKEELETLQSDFRKPLTDKENAKKERVAKIQEKITWMEKLPSEVVFLAESSGDIKKEIDKLQAEEISEDFYQEFAAKAEAEQKSAILQLKGLLMEFKEKEDKAKAEKEAEEKRLKEEQAKREKELVEKAKEEERLKVQKENEAKQKAKEKEEQAKRDEEQRKLKEQQDKLEADRKAIEDHKRKEAEELAKQQAEEKARLKNVEHKKKINNEILTDLENCGIKDGKKIVEAIVKGKIRHVKVSY